MAGLFIQLHAFFLAAVQVLVYAGAVMVLFIFVIMLLDLKQEERRRTKTIMAGLGIVVVTMIAVAMILTIKQSAVGYSLDTPTLEGSTLQIGQRLFTQYALPFEVLSLLLLVAMIGTVLLSKRDPK